MPYIKQVDRKKFLKMFQALPCWKRPGELNYAISLLCNNYLHWRGLSYQHINDVIGVLECAKQELYRRVVAPYEDKKIKENGDIL